MSDRHPCVAGAFYTADPQDLRASISRYLQADPEHAVQEPCYPHMLLLPHAGHMYCGHVIGAVLAQVRLPETLILLCPNHSGQGHPLAVWPDGQWHSPLGSVAVDNELATALTGLGVGFSADTQAHTREHSLEVLLPFLQLHSPHSRIVPICVALHDARALQKAAHALRDLLAARAAQGHNSCLIVSSDMNHFECQQNTVRKDGLALAPLLALQADTLLHTVIHNKITMCGVLPAVLAIHSLPEQHHCITELVRYTTSAEVTKDTDNVVGYCGIIVK